MAKSRKGKVALAPIIGTALGGAIALKNIHDSGVYWSTQTGSDYWEGIRKGVIGYMLGFQEISGKYVFNWELLMKGSVPLLGGMLGGMVLHKAASKTGFNRAISALPWVQL